MSENPTAEYWFNRAKGAPVNAAAFYLEQAYLTSQNDVEKLRAENERLKSAAVLGLAERAVVEAAKAARVATIDGLAPHTPEAWQSFRDACARRDGVIDALIEAEGVEDGE